MKGTAWRCLFSTMMPSPAVEGLVHTAAVKVVVGEKNTAAELISVQSVGWAMQPIDALMYDGLCMDEQHEERTEREVTMREIRIAG